jgi:hypothetical protein
VNSRCRAHAYRAPLVPDIAHPVDAVVGVACVLRLPGQGTL